MVHFDRSRFKAAKLEVNKSSVREAESVIKKTDNKRGDYHSIDDDRPNYFRLLPPHNFETEPSFQPKGIYWMECNVEKRNEKGEGIGEFERKSRPIFDSRIHGNTPRDIVDEYINFTKKQVWATIQDRDLQKETLYPITGYKDKKGKWHPGISLSTSYVTYATKNGILPENIGRLELYKVDKDRLEELNISEDSDEPILVDLLSDPNEGVEIVITFSLEGGKKKKVISKREADLKGIKGAVNIGEAFEKFQESQVVPDSVLERLSEMEPLSSMFKNAYKRSDFERALEALQYFDKKNGYNTFEHDEFLDIVQEIDGYYSDELDNSETKSDESIKTTAKSKFSINEQELDESIVNKSLDIHSLTREEIKEIIEIKELDVKVLRTKTLEQLQEEVIEILYPEEDLVDDALEVQPLSLKEKMLARKKEEIHSSSSEDEEDDLPF